MDDELTDTGRYRLGKWIEQLRPREPQEPQPPVDHEPERRREPRRECDRELEQKVLLQERREQREWVYRLVERIGWIALAIASLLTGRQMPL